VKNLLTSIGGIPSASMDCPISAGRRTVKPPAGCEGYLTRHQAAIQLGLRSEFKVRQFERDGRLHAVRGRMGTAFYPEAEVLALRAEFEATPRPTPGRWTDADLITLLGQPTTSGRRRTAVDLVTEARTTIARAERVYRFWSKRDETFAARMTSAGPLLPTSADGRVAPPAQPPAAQAPSVPRPAAADVDSASASERRSAARLAHDGLVRSLRNPDPRIRAEAFVKLSRGKPAGSAGGAPSREGLARPSEASGVGVGGRRAERTL
jgi:hypothetical protein